MNWIGAQTRCDNQDPVATGAPWGLPSVEEFGALPPPCCVCGAGRGDGEFSYEERRKRRRTQPTCPNRAPKPFLWKAPASTQKTKNLPSTALHDGRRPVFLVLTGACQFGHGVGGFATIFIHSPRKPKGKPGRPFAGARGGGPGGDSPHPRRSLSLSPQRRFTWTKPRI